jgi:hypothetical protein
MIPLGQAPLRALPASRNAYAFWADAGKVTQKTAPW